MDAEIGSYQDDDGDVPDVQERPTNAPLASNSQ
jgi:hypothetical protein